MKKILLMSMLVGVSLFSNEEILELSIIERSNPNLYPVIGLTSITDKVTIKGATINRGNCKLNSNPFPVTLKYGGQMSLLIYGGCMIKEIKIMTDMGERTYTRN